MKQINKMRENILNGGSNFVGTKSEKYCNIQEYCKELQMAITQYNKVVKQNQNLQSEILWHKAQNEKDNKYIIELEEKNMLQEEKLKQVLAAANEIFWRTDEANKFRRLIKNIIEEENANK